MASPRLGRKAPDFELTTDRGEPFRLSAHKDAPVVLFFYPADDTVGCTIENLEFTRELPDFDKLGAKVVGISPDTVESHCKFRDKYRLGVILAADPDRRAIRAYGVWGPKKTFGHEYMGVLRTSFLIAPDGTVAGIFRSPASGRHAAAVLEATRRLVAATA